MEFIDTIPPDFAYRFYHEDRLDHLLETVIFKKLYFAFVHEFFHNDILDSKCFNININSNIDIQDAIVDYIETNFPNHSHIEAQAEINKRIAKFGGNSLAFAKTCSDNIAETFKRNWDIHRFGILCMSEHPTKDMWIKYCDNFKGFCIQINVKILRQTIISSNFADIKECPNNHFFGKVNYINNPVNISYHDFKYGDSEKLAFAMLFTKFRESFGFEKEIRLVIPEVINQKLTFPEGIINKISIGENTSQNSIGNLLNCIKQNKIDLQIEFN